METIEIWQTIPGFSDYQVSNLGRVKSLKRKNERLLKPGTSGGYPFVCIMADDNTKVVMKIHRLVMLAFVGPCPDGLEVCHNNGDSGDNRLENLRYDTHHSNMLDFMKGNDGVGPNSTTTLEQRDKIGDLYLDGCSVTDIQEEMGVSINAIKYVIANRNLSTSTDVRMERAKKIRELYSTGAFTMQEIADEFEMSVSGVSRIVNQQRLNDGKEPSYPIRDSSKPEKKGVSIYIDIDLLEEMKIAIGHRSLSNITIELYRMWLDGNAPIVIQPIEG